MPPAGTRNSMQCQIHNRELPLRIRIIVPVIAITFLVSACGPSDSDFKAFATYRSPDGKYTVTIDSAHSVLAYGPDTIRVYVSATGSRVRNHIVTTKISNDGGIGPANISAEWTQRWTIKFCLNGVEQEDSVLEIDIRKLSHTERQEKCS